MHRFVPVIKDQNNKDQEKKNQVRKNITKVEREKREKIDLQDTIRHESNQKNSQGNQG
jgi:uncharacterized protein (UPF0335 family)